jgi:glycosyltransferase involved in cell wall biosynthesis
VTLGADPERPAVGAAGPGPAAPDVSVVTVSFGRVELVRRKLAALARQTAGAERLELVLVDNACPDGVGDAVEAAAWPFAVRVLRSERRLTAAAGRAWAAREARGRWLWWSDDDVVPADDALAALLAAQLAAQARGAGVTIGGVRYVTEGGTTRWCPRRPGPAQLTGVNTLFPRADVVAVQGDLPELPRPYGGEDALIGFALRARGLPFRSAPASWVDHHGPSPAAGGDLAKAYDAGYNAAAICDRYPAAAWTLGLHPLQVAVKRALVPLLAWTGPRMAGDLAYLRGALDRAAAVRSDASPQRGGPRTRMRP